MGNQEEGKLARAQASGRSKREHVRQQHAQKQDLEQWPQPPPQHLPLVPAARVISSTYSSRSHRCSPAPLPPLVCLPGACYREAYATWGQQSQTLWFVKCDWLCGCAVDVCGCTALGGRQPGGETEWESIRLGTCDVGPLNLLGQGRYYCWPVGMLL